MLEIVSGNLFDCDAQALVNTVNTVGVMGKGIALQFKEAYPHNFNVYRKACKANRLTTGQVLGVKDRDVFGERWIINFPTKQHWRQKSKYEYISEGLVALRAFLIEEQISSVAIPPLGCGNGGLEWPTVKKMIEEALADLPIVCYIFEPNANIQNQLRQKNKDTQVKMTPARAMLLISLYRYEEDFEPVSLFVATKLAYFLQRLGGPFEKLQFRRSYYGPYATGMNHFVRTFNGSYLTGLETNEARPFDNLPLNYARQSEITDYVAENLSAKNKQILADLERLTEGYKTAYGLEILATVAFIRQEKPELDRAGILKEARGWSNRKVELLRPEYIDQAVKRLDDYAVGFMG